MIATLPKKFEYTGDVPLFGEVPVMKLTPVINGVMLYELENNSLIGQIFFSPKERSATVSIAEESTFIVKNNGNEFSVEPFEGQKLSSRYVIFGNCRKNAYSVYEYADGKTQPVEAVKVTENPAQEIRYSAWFAEGSNVVKNLLIVVAINGIING